MLFLQRALVLAVALSLGACASKTQTRVTDAAATPLSDLHIVKSEIPSVLVAASKGAYALPDDRSCEALALQIGALDEVLGADLDAPPSDTQPSLLERGGSMAEDSAVGMVKRTAEGLVPFRSWVRKLSGAERHSRRVAAAITAGGVRRAFLKGMGASQGCAGLSGVPPKPAAPLVAEATPPAAAPQVVTEASAP